MAKQKKIELRHNNWRSVYLKILKNFRNTGFISNFEILNSIDINEVNCFKVYLSEALNFKIYFYKSKYREDINIAEDFFDHVSIMVGKFARPKTLEVILRKYLHNKPKRILLGMDIENIFYSRFIKIKSKNSISEILKASKNDDQIGIDFYLTYKDQIVPVQIKSSVGEQEKHKSKFPQIPSFVFVPENYTDKLLEIFLVNICDVYINGRVIHS